MTLINAKFDKQISALKRQGVRFTKKFLYQLKSPNLLFNQGHRFSIASTLAFLDAALRIMRLEDIVVEPLVSEDGDIDVSPTIDGRNIAFQLKSLFSFAAKYYQEIDTWIQHFYDNVLNKFGLFAKVLFTSSSMDPSRLQPYIINRKRVADNLDVSYGVLLFDVKSLQRATLGRVRSATRKCFSQLKDLSVNYKLAVIDIRYDAVNEVDSFNFIQTVFQARRYEELSGVLLMTFDLSAGGHTAGTKLIPIMNPHAKNPLDWGFLARDEIVFLNDKRFFFALASRIQYSHSGWHDCFHMVPEYVLTYKGKIFGSIF